MNPGDTIVAISSAVGAAARMIVRVSGPGMRELHARFTGSGSFVASARRVGLSFAGLSVPGWVYCFESSASVTGEDVVEFHVPGNPLLARMLLDELVRFGARQAEPGEFTARAYFNGKIDLAEAEGVAATIAAQNERELLAARQLMAGELAGRLRPVMDSLADTLALIEAGIDFTDQDITFLSVEQVRQRIELASHALTSLLQESARLERLSHEPQVVLFGRPNAGKSTLLNALAGHERAIVSPVAGTTRDILWAHVPLTHGMIRLVDVAGLEEHPNTLSRYSGRGVGEGLDQTRETRPSPQPSPRSTGSVQAGVPGEGEQRKIDQAMQQQAHRAIEEADLLVLVQDSTDLRAPMNVGREPDVHVVSKVDLVKDPDVNVRLARNERTLEVSVVSGVGMVALRDELDARVFGRSGTDATLALNARHVGLIEEARESLQRASKLLPDGGLELLAVELREALDALGGVLGSMSPDDVLGRVFSRFCIGK